MPTHVPFVSVSYGDGRPEELAYRDGAFVYPFRGSTRVGDTFSLRRTGGWPAHPTVHVEEALIGAIATWGVLYHVDFRTLPPATFSSPGSFTIDGLTWWLREKNGESSPTHTPAITAAGLAIGGPMNVAEAFSSFRGRRMQLPLANVPGYDPSAPVVIYSRTSSTNDGAFAVVSIVDSAPAATAMPEVEFARRQGLIRYGGRAADDGGRFHTGWRGFVNGPLSSSLIGGCAEVDVGRALYVLHRRSVGYGAFDWRGAMPNPWSGSIDFMMGDNTENFVNLSGVDVRDMGKLAIDVACNNNSAVSVVTALCELVIWQPGAGG